MREILFRGKRLKDSKWVEGMLTNDVKGHCRIQFSPMNFSAVVIPETVGQFTGLTDKNGTNIFEGDFVKWIDSDGNERIDVVRYHNGGFVLCNIEHHIGNYIHNNLEVVGNIHDNPELLK